MKSNKEKYPIGTIIYYSLDIDDLNPKINTGKISEIFYHDLETSKGTKKIKLYKVNDSLAMMSNAFYTIEELYKMADRLHYLTNEVDKNRALLKSISSVEKI